MTDKIPFSDAMKDDASRERIEDIIAMMRMALAPMFNDAPDDIPMNQSLVMTAAALFAGMTAGHMIGIGTMDEKDKRRAGAAVIANFRNGITIGKDEVRKAILEQSPVRGRA